MILGLIRLCVFGTILMTVVYLMVRYLIASRLREELEEQWQDRERNEPHLVAPRERWVDDRMREWRGAIRLRALLIAYVIPVCAFGAILLIVNFL